MNGKHYIDPSEEYSRFSEYEELERDYCEVDFTKENNESKDMAGIIVEAIRNEEGDVSGAMVSTGENNTIIVSATGAGKTRRVLGPLVWTCIFSKIGFLITDPKGELLLWYKSLLEKMGYFIKVLYLREPERGDSFNLCQMAAALWQEGKQDRALQMMSDVAKDLFGEVEDKNDGFWTTCSRNLFLCYFIIAASLYEPEHVTIATIYNIHVEGQERIGGVCKMQMYLEGHKDEKVYELGMPSIISPNETRASIFSVFSNGLANIILNEGIEGMTTDSSINVKDFINKEHPLALFIIPRDEAPEAYSTLLSSIVDLLYASLIDLAVKEYGGHLPRSVHFILEEFGNLGPLKGINDMLTAGRSRGLRFDIVLQSLCQLYMTYPEPVADVLIGNSQNLIYMYSTDMELVEKISKRCGNKKDPYTGEISPLLPPEKLMSLDAKQGETLMILGRHRPYISFLPDISCYKMIEPLSEISLPEREPVSIEPNRFTKALDKMELERVQKTVATEMENERDEKSMKRATRKQMLSMPAAVKNKLEKIIDDRRSE